MKSSQRQWSSGAYVGKPIADLPTQFELKCKRLGLSDSPEKWTSSAALRAWVKAHKNSRYVPEWLVQEYGLTGHYEGD